MCTTCGTRSHGAGADVPASPHRVHRTGAAPAAYAGAATSTPPGIEADRPPAGPTGDTPASPHAASATAAVAAGHGGPAEPRQGPEAKGARPQPAPEPAERAVAHGLLDVAPGERRERERRRRLQRCPREVEPRVRERCRQRDHREVPEVDAVGANADPAQRPPAEGAAEPGGRVREGGDDHRGRDREQHRPRRIEEGRVRSSCARRAAR